MHEHSALWFRKLSLVLCISAAPSFSVSRAVAQASQVQAQSSEPDYQSLVQKGLREYELGNLSEAKAFFQQAHQLSPNARTLRGLGMTSYEMRRYVEAIEYFEHALRALTAQMRNEVSQLLDLARSQTRVRSA